MKGTSLLFVAGGAVALLYLVMRDPPTLQESVNDSIKKTLADLEKIKAKA